MKTRTFRILSVAALALTALSAPALAHDGYFYGRHYGRPHFVYPGQRVVIVRPPVFLPRPVVVYRPGPVYYAPAPYYPAPAPVYYAQPWGTIGGAIAAASVIGALLGNGLSR